MDWTSSVRWRITPTLTSGCCPPTDRWGAKRPVFFYLLANLHRSDRAADNDCEHESRDQILHIFLPRLRQPVALFSGFAAIQLHQRAQSLSSAAAPYLFGIVSIFVAPDRPFTLRQAEPRRHSGREDPARRTGGARIAVSAAFGQCRRPQTETNSQAP